jgi:thiamine-phosphate pyrophosphorylase
VADKRKIFRVLDANLNRLREALRVIEEYYRFIDGRPAVCRRLKKLRHGVADVEAALGREPLLDNRDTGSDCFAGRNRPEECDRRAGVSALLAANFRRGQEAGRVIEEYAKIAGGDGLSEKAKKIRFTLYAFEKELLSGKGEKRARQGRRRVSKAG